MGILPLTKDISHYVTKIHIVPPPPTIFVYLASKELSSNFLHSKCRWRTCGANLRHVRFCTKFGRF